MPLNDPAHQDSVPIVGGDSPASRGDRFRSSPLSRAVTAFMYRSLERNQLRRNVYSAGHLRVCIAGEERLAFDPKVGVCEPFRVPISTSSIEVFGDDDDGALLLAVFPLPEPEVMADDQPPYMALTLEGGQTVEVDIALAGSTGGELGEYVIQISYWQSPESGRRNAENPLIEAIPRVPFLRTSTPRNAASRHPDNEDNPIARDVPRQ
jgi:hypothetical protein